MNNNHANWNYPTSVRFGDGRINELGEVCKELGINQPLVVTDVGLAKLPVINDVVAYLPETMSVGLFSEVHPNPTGQDVEQGCALFNEGGYDGVIAVGGGSALDAGKSIALMAKQTVSLWDLEDVGENWKAADSNAIVPIIAVPTTAGTGSEVGRAAVILDEQEKKKKIIFHPAMIPPVVLGDPELTHTLPAPITAATGVDALVHNLEALCAPGFHPLADGIAVEAIKLIYENLHPVYQDGKNAQARGGMLAASLMGATAFQKGLGAVHALAHPLGALYKAHHGLLNAIILPYVLVKNRAAIDTKLTDLARYLDLPHHSFLGFYDWVLKLRNELAIPNALSEIGISDEDTSLIGKMALEDPSAAGNPIKLTSDEYQELFVNAVNGEGLL